MSDRPHVRTDPALRFGRPVVGGVSVEAVAEHVWAGESVGEVADDFGLRREDVLVACWWLGLHGSKSQRPLFEAWAERVAGDLGRQEYDVPDPPSGG